jgi:UDP-N-acetylmuramoyl-L-alanyl-D-glutamate--2,6-diaminopimelate ligase
VPGRLEPIDEGQGFLVLVDYSHTPDSLDGALRQARTLVAEGGRVIGVFGCGGDRDATKRALMGQIAGDLGDAAWLTSDNPRTEDPKKIADQAHEGLKRSRMASESIHVELDRRRAIEEALGFAKPGDAVLIAGKGHETYQEIGTERIDFDDAAVARTWLRRSGGGR